MNAHKYNGWYNYETWLVKLWIDNEEGSHCYWKERAETALAQAEPDKPFTKEERAKLNLMDALKSEYEDASVDILERAKLTASVWSDLLSGALAEVNWHEIASSMINDAIEATATTPPRSPAGL